MEPVTRPVRVVVLTQACDWAQLKANRILVACVHSARELVERNVLQGRLIRDQIRTHRVYGWYFLPSGPALSESIVDLRDLHTVPRAMLERLIQQGKRLTRIATPYREHLAQPVPARVGGTEARRGNGSGRRRANAPRGSPAEHTRTCGLCGQGQTGSGDGLSAAGTVNGNVLPFPGELCTATAPPWASTSCFTSANPIPEPDLLRSREGSAL